MIHVYNFFSSFNNPKGNVFHKKFPLDVRARWRLTKTIIICLPSGEVLNYQGMNVTYIHTIVY